MSTIQDVPARPSLRSRAFPWGFAAWTVFVVAMAGFTVGVMWAVVAFRMDPYAAYINWQVWALLLTASVSTLVAVWRWRAAWLREVAR